MAQTPPQDRPRMSSIVTRVFGLDDHGRPLHAAPDAAPDDRDVAELVARNAAQPVILFLAANPKGTQPVGIPNEFQDIRDRLRSSEFGRQFNLAYEPAAIFKDLAFYLLEATPSIVHFSGHGAVDGIALDDETGAARLISNEALRRLFKQPDIIANLRLVVLNSCFSASQAATIVEHVDCVVGMNRAVPDATARAFSNGLYTALGAGVDVAGAFELAQAQIDVEALPGDDIPILLARDGIDPRTVRPLDVEDASEQRAGATDALRVDRVAPAAVKPNPGIIKVGDRHWRWQGTIPSDIDAVYDAIDQAMRRMPAGSVEARSRTVLVARTGGLLNGRFGATEEIIAELADTPGGTKAMIQSRSLQVQISDFGRNEANIRLLLGLLGVSEH